MIKYIKIIGGEVYDAPSIIIKDGKQYINPPKELYIEMGYEPIEYDKESENDNDEINHE